MANAIKFPIKKLAKISWKAKVDTISQMDLPVWWTTIPDNIGLRLRTYLWNWNCFGARTVLTDNIGVSNRLINGSIGTVKHLHMRSKPLCSTVYVKFDYSKAGNFLKDMSLWWFEGMIPITARAKRFHLKKSKELLFLKENNSQWYLVMQLLSISLKDGLLWIMCKAT